MRFHDRREFLKDGGKLAAAGLLGHSAATADKPTDGIGPASDRLRVALLGVKSRGAEHAAFIAGKNNCEIVTICDVDEAVIGKAMTTAEQQQKKAPKFEKDLRKVLDANPTISVKVYHSIALFLCGRLRVTTTDLSFARERNIRHF